MVKECMQILIKPTEDISPEILEQVKAHSPWEGLKSQLGEKNPSDVWVGFAQNNISGYIEDHGKLACYSAIGQDKFFNHNIASAMGLDPAHTTTLMYLFTVSAYQKQGYAKQLVDALASYTKKNISGVEHLIWTTHGERLKELYIGYGAELYTTLTENEFIKTQHMDTDYYFKYPLTNF